jgi:dTDP-N-acetylfucosamine:lipid II N-acetylfucosaminyltransferase
MIFHICPPDTLFVKFCVERFERLKPGINRCIIIVSSRHHNAEHSIDNKLVDYFGPLTNDIVKKINKSNCSAVIMHTLNDDLLELALNLNENIPLIWRSWGPDLHNLIYPEFQPLLPHTQKLVSNKSHLTESLFRNFRPLRNSIFSKALTPEERLRKKISFLKRVSLIATVTETEYKLLFSRIPELKIEKINLNYRQIDFNNISKNSTPIVRNSVMVGHSSFPYHNHADVFFQLSGFNEFSSTILVPVNYGNFLYRKKLIVLGKSIFGLRSHFLIDFLPFDDYIKVIGENKAFILNSKIQSGGANVIYSLILGLKVYLRNENPIYTDFKNAGIKLFSVQDDLSSDHLEGYVLSDAEKRNNIQIVRSLFNTEREIENVRKIYSYLNILC